MSMWDKPRFVKPDREKAVLLERVSSVPRPEYVVAGKTMCMACDEWCWLDRDTLRVVHDERATPFCLECGQAAPGVSWPEIGDARGDE